MWWTVSRYGLFSAAMEQIKSNPDQYDAVVERGHCVVLAGPGSGKTKTLTVAMARALLEDVQEPRGIACITYSNECAIELEARLSSLGIEPSERVFVGTIHSFAFSQVILPYARCAMPKVPADLRIASLDQRRRAIERAYDSAIGGAENPHERWRYAETKRSDVDRSKPSWATGNLELAVFIEAYEAELRRQGLIDFDDMPLMAFDMVRRNEWIRHAIRAKFPVLFIDEYQDLGYALHELVLLLCFQAGIRLFAVGDPDQSIYSFQGANPRLLQSLASRGDVKVFRLKLNYRCGTKIVVASIAALGEKRDYRCPGDAEEGTIHFHPIRGGLCDQADYIFRVLLPSIQSDGISLDRIAVLYREANQGDSVAAKASEHGVPVVRADNNALVKRSSRLCRFVEACARWVTGGWREADPSFARLSSEACRIVLGPMASQDERMQIQSELVRFLRSTLDRSLSTYDWLTLFRDEVLRSWRERTRASLEDWDHIDTLIERTDPATGEERCPPLSHFGGRVEGSGRLNLSTFHSAKGREFDAVIMFAINAGLIPKPREMRNAAQTREIRRLSYVGVTRARRSVHMMYEFGNESVLVSELRHRLLQSSA